MFSRSADRANRHIEEYDEDWLEPTKPKRDLKKALLIFGLGALSWVATYVGMLELIQANMGALDFTTKIVIGFSVAMLMTMIIWLLDQMFAPHPFAVKLSYITGYAFLTLISVGFGFGFYWKVLESRSEASRSAESAVAQVQASLLAGAARLDQLQGTLDQLTLISQEKAVLEREKGTSCPNSRPGDGPRRRLRDEDAGRFSFASNFVKGRSAKVKADMRALDGDLKKIVNGHKSTFDKATGTRNKFLQALSRKLELTATSFNAFRTDPQLRQIRSELAERANRSTFPNGRGGTFSCPDGQLQSALFGVVKAIDGLPELGKPEIATVEGAQAVVEAFRRLTATLQGALVFKLPPSADELRALQTKAVRSVEGGRNTAENIQGGLSKRDYIPLAIAVFVDFCLLLVSIGRPMNRLGGLVPKMREAERGPVYQILSKFDDIHRDPEVREKFEVFRHVVFDFNGDYYVAVPLDAPRNRNPDEVKNLQLEAHLLGNLFASFEKEKIFSRVYNPLLSSKTIQRKLWRQGSKFAASQAFRTYRFRDGAWSDIILGAVMGAARRAKAERIRQAREAGPQLGLPVDPVEARAREIIAATVAAQTADVREQLAGQPLTHGGEGDGSRGPRTADAVEDVATMARAFAPLVDAAEGAPPDADTDQSASRRMTWPYQRPPEDPSEAEVDLLPANSNTSPERPSDRLGADASSSSEPQPATSDNVILMPLPADQVPQQPEPTNEQTEQQPAAYTDALVRAMSDEVGEADAGLEDISEPLHVQPPPLPKQQPVVQDDVGTSMNVRITQRSADFHIPMNVTSNGHPVDFIKTGMRAALMLGPAQEATVDQAVLEAGSTVPDDQVLNARIEAEAEEVEPVVLLQPVSDDDELVVETEIANSSTVLSEDDLEEISRRFAPKA